MDKQKRVVIRIKSKEKNYEVVEKRKKFDGKYGAITERVRVKNYWVDIKKQWVVKKKYMFIEEKKKKSDYYKKPFVYIYVCVYLQGCYSI